MDALNDRLNNPNTRCDGGSGGGGGAAQQPVLTENPTQKPTRKPTSKPTKKPTKQPVKDDGGQEIVSVTQSSSSEVEDSLYYPYFESDTAECRSDDGSRPFYVRQNMLVSSESICCETYYFHDLVEECKTSSYNQKPFYPDFQDHACVNDGNHPEWMAGNYLEKNNWLCCHNFFSYNEQLLDKCLGN